MAVKLDDSLLFGVLYLLTALGLSKEGLRYESEYRVTLDATSKFNVSWIFTGTKANERINFTVEVETTGWVGLGFSPKGSMAGADIVIAWVNGTGASFLIDMMGESNGLPAADKQQNTRLVFATEKNGKTTVAFSRNIDTCDFQDLPLKTDTTRLIYAYGTADPSGDILTGSDYHGDSTRGAKSLYLFDPVSAIDEIPDEAFFHDVTTSEYNVPSDDTTYYCSFHEVPVLHIKHHLIAVKPLITLGNEALVHHMTLFACWNVTKEHMQTSDKRDGVCYTSEMPEFARSCRRMVYAWAIGGTGYVYPNNTGYPLGGEGSPEYFMLETHYDNPGMVSGIKDDSGARLIYTPVLRDIEIGLVSLGAVLGLVIPPGSSRFEVTAYCHSTCTNQWIPPEGISVFSYVLHAHLMGIKLQIDIYRTDGSVEVFAVDNSYDFNFQEARLFPEPKKLYPGDTLKLTCTMNSSDRTALSLGGQGARDEMCFAYLNYYPRTPISHCGSVAGFQYNPEDALYKMLDVQPDYYQASSYVNIRQSLAGVSWNSETRAKAQAAVHSTSQYSTCWRSNGQGYEVNLNEFQVSMYNITLVEAGNYDSVCVSSATRLGVGSFTATLSLLLYTSLQ